MNKNTSLLTLLALLFFSLLPLTNAFSQKAKHLYKQGQISTVIGRAQSKRKISKFRTLTTGALIRQGDTIKTFEDGYVEIVLFNEERIRIYNNTKILIRSISTDYMDIALQSGSLLLTSTKGNSFRYYISGTFFTLSSKAKESTDSRFYIEHKNSLVSIMLIKGVLSVRKGSTTNIDKQDALQQREDSIDFEAKAIISFSNEDALKDIELRKDDKYIEDYEEDKDKMFEDTSTLDDFNPNFKTKVTENDPFYKTTEQTTDRQNVVKNYREKSSIYYNIDFGALAWIGSEFYFSLGFYPEFRISDFTIRLRFMLYFPYANMGKLNKYYNIDEWKFKRAVDYLNKIDLFEYKDKDSLSYFRLIPISKKSLGYGLIVRDYTNELFYPKNRYLGLDLAIRFPVIDIEAFVTDLSNFKTMGFRIESRPFATKDEGKYHYSLGINFSMDLASGTINDNPDIYLGSIDLGIPIIRDKRSYYQVLLYAEFGIAGYELQNSNVAKSFGTTANVLKFTNSFGMLVGFQGLLYKYFLYDISYSYLQNNFVPGYIDTFYEMDQEDKIKLLLSQDKTDNHGFSIGLGVLFTKYIRLYSELYIETGNIAGLNKTNNRFKLEIKTSKSLSPLFVARLLYIRNNIKSFTNFFRTISDNAFIILETNTALTNYLDMNLGYRHFAETKNSFNDLLYINFLFIL